MSIVPYQPRRRNGDPLAMALLSAIGSMALADKKKIGKVAGEAALAAGLGKAAHKALRKAIDGKTQPSLRGARRAASSESASAVPVSLGYTETTGRASTIQTRSGIRVSFRELISESLAGNTAFSITSQIAVNPGLSASFPWLSVMAQQYEQYKIHSLVYEYVPYVPTTTQGTVVMFMDYSASDPQPSSETQAMNHPGAICAPVWQGCKFSARVPDMFPTGPRKYVRDCLVAGDDKLYDAGTFYLCVDNETSTATIGKLFARYDIEFFTPQLTGGLSSAPQNTTFLTAPGPQTISTGVATNVAFGSLGVDVDALNWYATYVGASKSFTPPRGYYRIHFITTVKDTANESSRWDLTFLKNSNAYGATTSFHNEAGGANFEGPLSGVTVVAFNGTTDTFAVNVSVTGAAGTLTVSQTQLVITMA